MQVYKLVWQVLLPIESSHYSSWNSLQLLLYSFLSDTRNQYSRKHLALCPAVSIPVVFRENLPATVSIIIQTGHQNILCTTIFLILTILLVFSHKENYFLLFYCIKMKLKTHTLSPLPPSLPPPVSLSGEGLAYACHNVKLESEDIPGHQSLPSTLLETVSLVHCRLHQASSP